MNTFNIKSQRYYLGYDSFKSKPLAIVLNSIGGSRLNDMITFNKYAKISFNKEDAKKEFINLEELDSFTRNKVNAVIFNILPEITTEYNKLVVFHDEGHDCGFYHFILFNTENDNTLQKFFIDHSVDALIIGLYKILYKFNADKNNILTYI